jgi:hypothetical protein
LSANKPLKLQQIFAFHLSLKQTALVKASGMAKLRDTLEIGLRVWVLLPIRCQKLPILGPFHAFLHLCAFDAYRKIVLRACIHEDLLVLEWRPQRDSNPVCYRENH